MQQFLLYRQFERMTLGPPATYLSRHEESFEFAPTEEEIVIEKDIVEQPMAADTDSHGSSGSQYLQDVLGDVLAEALSKVAKERPEDPIQYVANYLHSLKPIPPAPIPEEEPRSPTPEPEQEHFDEHVEPAEVETEAHQSRLEEYKESVDRPNSSPRQQTPRYRTAHSEPPPSIGGSVSNPGTSSSNASSNFLDSSAELDIRTRSLDRRNEDIQDLKSKKSRNSRKSTSFSKRLPAVAMSKNDYRAKRGLLPPMKQSPKSSPEGEPKYNAAYGSSRYGGVKQKPRQLAPIPDDFDIEKHNRRNKKLSNRTSVKV